MVPKGIDGFRLDVINLISKDQSFPDAKDGHDGRPYYTDGPRVHEFLHEMNREVFSKYDSMTVGEMSSTTADHCIRYTNPESKELDMTFNFHHLKVDYPNGEKWALAPFDFLKLKRILAFWQTEMQKAGAGMLYSGATTTSRGSYPDTETTACTGRNQLKCWRRRFI